MGCFGTGCFVLYLSGKRRADMPYIATPNGGESPAAGQIWAADSGRFASPHRYSDERYLAWLAWRAHLAADCLFATAPDVVGNATATLALSAPMFARIRDLGYRVAFVAQDGWPGIDVPWDDFDALFLGGTTAWKLGHEAADAAAEARARGKWVHMGRVNSLRRLRMADAIGCDSADGTVLRFDQTRPIHEWVDAIHARPSLWRTA